MKSAINDAEEAQANIRTANIGRGTILIGDDLPALLEHAGCVGEPFTGNGMRFIRRKWEDGHTYFVANQGSSAFDSEVTPVRRADAAVIYDPVSGRAGTVPIQDAGSGRLTFRLRLEPGESRIIRITADEPAGGAQWHHYAATGKPVAIESAWDVTFIDGEPSLPPDSRIRELVSWTEFGGPGADSFHGTARYSTTFTVHDMDAHEWRLDLGDVRESARVYINGEYAGAAWCLPFRLNVGQFIRQGENTLDVEVTNLAANRIRDLDRRGVDWKIFHDINYVNIRYEPFDAAGWDLMESGLLGPVRLMPLREDSE